MANEDFLKRRAPGGSTEVLAPLKMLMFSEININVMFTSKSFFKGRRSFAYVPPTGGINFLETLKRYFF